MEEQHRTVPIEAVLLYTDYAHGEISRRQFLDGINKIAVGSVAAAALIEALCEGLDVGAQMLGGVEDARTVAVGGELVSLCACPDLFKDGERCAAAAGHVVGVLDLDEAGRGTEVGDRIEDRLDVVPGEDAGVGGHGADEAAGEDGGGGHLPVEDVGA